MRSNGDLPCHDDIGENIILGRVQLLEKNWSIGKVLSGPLYTSIRSALRDEREPWPDTCSRCAWFSPNEEYSDSLADLHIKTFQVEPSLACNLKCPCCSNPVQLIERPKPFRMSLDLFESILRSLRDDGFSIAEIEYAGQGEPMTNPQFSEFVGLARDLFPDTKQRLITNGNFDYGRANITQAIDEIMVSCDGLFQESYERYRVGGNVDKVLKFMADIPKFVADRRQKVIWKYILFEFNDSDEEIVLAQRKAEALGIDGIFFVFTHSLYKSIRYTEENSHLLPVVWSGTILGSTPIHFQNVRKMSPTDQTGWPAEANDGRTVFMFDHAVLNGQGEIHLNGWALSEEPISRIQIACNGLPVGSSLLNQNRPDVESAYPGFGQSQVGFALHWIPERQVSGVQVIEAKILSEKGHVIANFRRSYSTESQALMEMQRS